MADNAAPKGKDDDPEVSAAAFEALERDFQEVLANLAGDKSLEKFRMEYEKLHRALKRSHDHEKKLIKKVRELTGEIANRAASVHQALKLSQEDQNTIATLRKEIEKAWKLVDVGHDKETKAKETITQLKDEIGNLSKLVEKGAKMSAGQETMVKELMKTREDLQRAAEEQAAQAKVLETQLLEVHNQREKQDADYKAKLEEVASLSEAVRARDGEVSREQRRRARLDEELRDTRLKLEAAEMAHDARNADAALLQTKVKALQQQLKEGAATMDRYLRDYEALSGRTAKVTAEYEEALTKNSGLHAALNAAEKEDKAKREEAARLGNEKRLLEKRLERGEREKLDLQQKLDDTKQPFAQLQAEKLVLEKDLEQYRRAERNLKAEKDAAERMKGLQEMQTQRALDIAKDNSDQAKEQERIAYSLESEVNGLKAEVKEQRAHLAMVERERERFGVGAQEQRSLYLDALDEIKVRDLRVEDLLKKVEVCDGKLKQQQQLYEQVRGERNLTAKHLVEARDGIAELQRKFKIMSHQTDQLKEEIAAKDGALVKESFAHQKVVKKSELQDARASRADKLLKANEDVIHKQEVEVQRLAAMIRRMDDEALTQRKEYDQVVNERDILGTQLIRRNDELALLYEKLKIQVATLRTGEVQYASRLEDLRVLRRKVKDLLREASVKHSQGAGVDAARRELVAAQQELLHEKIKVKALSEELENPLNVHRWRRLEGSDPATYEMVQKIQTLQKRLIAKTEAVVERDLLLAEKDRVHGEIKGVLARQPGPEVAEQLSVYQASLRAKGRQIKAMASELNMYQAQSNEFKHEVERLGRELQDTKRKYYEQRRREQLAADLLGPPPVGSQQQQQQQHNGGGGGGGGGMDESMGSGGQRTAGPRALGFGGASFGRTAAQQQLALAQGATTRYAGGGFAIK